MPVWFTLLLILPYSYSLRCYPPPGSSPPPILAHCHELASALVYASHLPHNNQPKTWGRGLPSEGETESLPKTYWLAGRGPSTCALDLDADPQHLDAREVFQLRDVGFAARNIVAKCLEDNRYLGSDTLGPTGHVVGRIVRTDSPQLLQATERTSVLWTIPGKGELLVTSGVGNGTLDDVE